jgi:lactoylglutathione lyase
MKFNKNLFIWLLDVYGVINMKVKYATIIVEDMDESIRFYTEVMGFEIDSQYNLGAAGAITLLKGEGDTMIEIIKNQ